MSGLPQQIFAKAKPGAKAGKPDNARHKELAGIEAQVVKMADLIGDVR